jgi:hypothetical protein
MRLRPAALCTALALAAASVAAAADFVGQYKAADGSAVIKIEAGDSGTLKATIGPPDGSDSPDMKGTTDGSKLTLTTTRLRRSMTMTGRLPHSSVQIRTRGSKSARLTRG